MLVDVIAKLLDRVWNKELLHTLWKDLHNNDQGGCRSLCKSFHTAAGPPKYDGFVVQVQINKIIMIRNIIILIVIIEL